MYRRVFLIVGLCVIVALALGACAPRATPTTPPAKKIKVGLVTDIGGLNDKAFNQSAWAGVQKAISELGLEGKVVETKQPTDYEKSIDQLVAEKHDVIITVGFLMGDATAAKAKQYKDIKFAIVDHAYSPKPGNPDPYATDLKNVTSLVFAEDQAGYLAGVVAGGMTKTGTVCSVAGMETLSIVRYIVGYQSGVKAIRPDVKTLNASIPSFTEPIKGKESAQSMIAQGCDVLFGVGPFTPMRSTSDGGLLAAKEKGLMAIGSEVDQYITYPDVREALLTSAVKNADVAVFEYLKAVKSGAAPAGVVTADVKNGGVGLAPYHDWETKIPEAVKDRIKMAVDGLKAGTLSTGSSP